MEEDVGKFFYVGGFDGCIFGVSYFFMDYNWVGVFFIEIVIKLICGLGVKVF